MSQLAGFIGSTFCASSSCQQSIEEPQVIAKILAHLERTAPQPYPTALPLGARAPPLQARLL